jgi:hypothetical protein
MSCAANLVFEVLSSVFPSCLALTWESWETRSKVDPSIPQLREEFRRKHHGCDIPRRDEIQPSPMGQFSKPMIVGLLVELPLVEQGDHNLQCLAFE